MSADLAVLVASPHFRWRVGLPVQETAAVGGGGVIIALSAASLWGDAPRVRDSRGREGVVNPAYLWPVTDDPFFKGWLLHLVREAWGPSKRVVIQLLASGGWRPVVYEQRVGTWVRCDVEAFFLDNYATEVEGLIAALLAAPAKDGGS